MRSIPLALTATMVIIASVFSVSAAEAASKPDWHPGVGPRHEEGRDRHERRDRDDHRGRDERRDHREHRGHDNRYGDRHDRHYGGDRHRRDHHGDHHRRRDGGDAGAFIGGLILGAMADDYHSDRRHYRRHYRSGYRHYRRDTVIYERNRYGECFRVSYRYGRKIYVEVPRYKCRAHLW